MANLANIAATNMEHLCNCDAHGYSQSQRWGDESLGTCYVECESHTSIFYAGDRDCSSAVIDCWQEALKGTEYEGRLDGATYTGNMRDVFVNSGLFSWQPMSFIAQRGDIYLNEVSHTAMCVDDGSGAYGYDALAEFSISETGGIYGSSGDQTGSEAYIHGYYDYPWDGILHYEGPADIEEPAPSSQESVPVVNNWRGYGIDISSWQADLDPYSVDADFIIIKVSQGTGYENATWREKADATLNSGKLLGLYHYAGGENAEDEARYFLSKCSDYVGRAWLCLDWESEQNSAFGNSSWCDEFLTYVQNNTNTTPLLYGGQYLLSDCPNWPHWIAQYPDYTPTGYQEHPWNEGAYDCEIRQYTSTGNIDGYNGNLDLNKAYITYEQWIQYMGGEKVSQKVEDTSEGDMTVSEWVRFNGLNEYVKRLYAAMLHREGDFSGEQHFTRITDGDIGQMPRDILNSEEWKNLNLSNEEAVHDMYIGILGRTEEQITQEEVQAWAQRAETEGIMQVMEEIQASEEANNYRQSLL